MMSNRNVWKCSIDDLERPLNGIFLKYRPAPCLEKESGLGEC